MTDLKKIFHSFGINDLLNASTSGLLLFKEDRSNTGGGVKYVCTVDNAAAKSLTGWESLAGKNWDDIADVELLNEELLPRQDLEIYFKQSNTWCRASNVPVDAHHFMCTLTNITPRKELEKREALVKNILHDAEQTMQFGSWVWDLENDKLEWSDGIFSILGYSPAEMATMEASYPLYLTHVHPDDVQQLDEAVKNSFKTKASFSVEYRIMTVQGEEKYLVSRGQFNDGDHTRAATSIGCAFDLTSIKSIQNELERKVADLNRSNFDLEQFAYVASHDLQEPLRKIVSFGERLELRSKGALNEEMGLYLDRILNATRRMQDMINNLLEYSRVTRSREGFKKTDLNQILKSTMSDLEIAIQRQNAQIEVEDLPVIDAIPSQMSQLFMNLLSNSLKFTNEDQTPLITIQSDRLSKSDQLNYGLPANREYVRITVSDNGIGFENNESSKIFTLFQRLRGRSEYEGAGIGLAVCKKVAENHSGIIMAYGKPSEGASFTMVFPISQGIRVS
ncbi:sensor histidine kinase [Arundinibacter roseus]|uniref:histidine kinase n=1 Tax=Arundinibacter roseus TaxID=2070510 RepID=A0A4V2X9U8_9BACT|nr:ATP-binding protein [Arundinibacter roseus]TDB65185.1 hypothetical protein EZE20_10775 [Arundinibacter roseus]